MHLKCCSCCFLRCCGCSFLWMPLQALGHT